MRVIRSSAPLALDDGNGPQFHGLLRYARGVASVNNLRIALFVRTGAVKATGSTARLSHILVRLRRFLHHKLWTRNADGDALCLKSVQNLL